MGSGNSTLEVPPSSYYEVKLYEYVSAEGDYNFTALHIDEGASKVEYRFGKHADADREVSTVEEPTEGDDILRYEHVLSDDDRISILKYLNGSPSLVPNRRKAPSEAEIEDARIRGEELPNPDDAVEVEENHPLSELASSENYVHIMVSGQFSGPPFRELFSGIALPDRVEALRKQKAADPTSIKKVRSAFKRQPSRGDIILNGALKKKKSKSEALKFLQRERRRAAAAFNAGVMRPLSHGGKAVLAGAEKIGETMATGVEAVGRAGQATGSAIGKSAQATGSAIGKGVKATGSAIGKGAQATGSAIGKSAQAAGSAIGKGAETITLGAEKVGEKIAHGVEKVGTAVAVPIVAAEKGIEKAAAKTIEGISKGVEKMGLPQAAEGISNAAHAVGEGIHTAGSKVGDGAKAVGRGVHKAGHNVKVGTQNAAAATGRRLSKARNSVNEFAGNVYTKFGNAMSAMKQSTGESLEKLWAKSEKQRARAKAAFKAITDKLEARHARQRQKLQEKLDKEREAEEAKLREAEEKAKEEAKAQLEVILSKAKARVAALGKMMVEKKNAEERARIEKEQAKIAAEVDAVKKKMDDADKRLAAQHARKKAKMLKRLKERQEAKIMALLQQQELEAKDKVDTFLAKEVALAKIGEEHSLELQKLKIDHEALERRIMEEEMAAYDAEQATAEGKEGEALKAEYAEAEEKMNQKNENAKAKAKAKAQARVEARMEAKRAELARIEEEKRLAMEAAIAAAEKAIRDAVLGEEASSVSSASKGLPLLSRRSSKRPMPKI